MPINSAYTDVVRTIMTGVVSFDELARHVTFCCSLEIDSSLWIEFTDQSDTDYIDVSSDQAAKLADMARPIHDKYSALHNILLAKTPGAFGANRMIETYISFESDKPVWHFVKSQQEAERLISNLLNSDANKSFVGT